MRPSATGSADMRSVRRVRRQCAGVVSGVVRRLRRVPPLKGGRETAHSASSGDGDFGSSALPATSAANGRGRA